MTHDYLKREKLTGAAGAIVVHLLLAVLILGGFGITRTVSTSDIATGLKVLPVEDLPPPLVVAPPKPKPAERPAPASPPNLRQEPTPIVAPEPIVRPPVIPPIVTAPVAGRGAQADAGAAPVAGPGTGAGGEGDGRGGGGDGDGDGGGGGLEEVPPRQIGGRLRNSDYPRAVGDAGVGGRVSVRYLVGINGRVGECRITRSSGNPELDATTCRLISERFRFRPSLDDRGRPVPAWLVENHDWVVEE